MLTTSPARQQHQSRPSCVQTRPVAVALPGSERAAADPSLVGTIAKKLPVQVRSMILTNHSAPFDDREPVRVAQGLGPLHGRQMAILGRLVSLPMHVLAQFVASIYGLPQRFAGRVRGCAIMRRSAVARSRSSRSRSSPRAIAGPPRSEACAGVERGYPEVRRHYLLGIPGCGPGP